MALSGSYDYQRTATQIIARAFRQLRVSAPDATDNTNALEALESLFKELQNDIEFPWTYEWTTQTFTASSEVIGVADGLNYRCISPHTAAAANRPITGASWSTNWYQDGSSGVTWVDTTAYTAIGDITLDPKVLYISKAYIRQNSSDSDVELIDRHKYSDLVDKYNTGIPSCLYLYPQHTPRILLWPQPDSTEYVLHYYQCVKLQDFDDAANNPDINSSWLNPLVALLADALAGEFAMKLDERKYLEGRADRKVKKAKKSVKRERNSNSFVESAF